MFDQVRLSSPDVHLLNLILQPCEEHLKVVNNKLILHYSRSIIYQARAKVFHREIQAARRESKLVERRKNIIAN